LLLEAGLSEGGNVEIFHDRGEKKKKNLKKFVLSAGSQWVVEVVKPMDQVDVHLL